MNKVLELAEFEERTRREASVSELTQLEALVKMEKATLEPAIIISTVKQDADRIGQLNKEILASPHPHPALKFNKLENIFACTLNILDSYPAQAITGQLLSVYNIDVTSRSILKGTKAVNKINNYLGTSMPNCIQNTYLTVLRLQGQHAHIQDIEGLATRDIYQIKTSPNIQTTKLIQGFDSSLYHDWFYYYKDPDSPVQGELLVPNWGYAFGGSRNDARYTAKYFKAEDCSSAIAKWTESSQSFATFHMKAFHTQDLTCDSDTLCQAVKEVLVPMYELPLNLTGLIFWMPGHTGVVSNQYQVDGVSIVETLSYSRDMPDVEGLGYQNYSIGEKEFLFFHEKAVPDVVGLSQADSNEEL